MLCLTRPLEVQRQQLLEDRLVVEIARPDVAASRRLAETVFVWFPSSRLGTHDLRSSASEQVRSRSFADRAFPSRSLGTRQTYGAVTPLVAVTLRCGRHAPRDDIVMASRGA